MGWNGVGWMVAVGLSALGTAVTYLWPQAREFGFLLLGVGILAFLIALLGAVRSAWPHLKAATKRLGAARMILLVSILGTWFFMSLTMGAAAYWVYQGQGRLSTQEVKADEGPLSWFQGFTSMDGGLNGFNVFSLRFQGANISKEAVELKSAHITSLIDGTRLDLEIVGTDAAGESKIVPINRVQLITPGAPLELVAKFGPEAPNEPGKVMGLEPTKFLEKWRQFAFDATDNNKTYHFEVNERAFMVFFKGKVGPRVTIKPDDVK